MVAAAGLRGFELSDIFQEIDEELRRDNFLKLWQRYGKYVIALAIFIVLVTAGVVGWREYQLKQRYAEALRYAAALDLARQGKDGEAADAFAALAQVSDGGRAVLAKLEEAATRAKAGDAAAAVQIYDRLAGDGSLDPVYRGIATLLAARLQLDDGDPKAVIERLTPLTDGASPWHPTALELTALAQLKTGDRAAARTTYQRISDDQASPDALRARATELVKALQS